MMGSGTRILVTGAAGFVGYHVANRLLAAGCDVLGLDNFSAYYDVALKERRAALLEAHPGFRMARISVDDMPATEAVWRDFAPDIVLHLAAQPGVRYSIDHPEAYITANLIATFNVLELARHTKPKHLLVASTSSIYGANTQLPFDELQRCATPVSLYAATKGATELMGHSYAHLFGVPMTFFRFFTVYGPWGRPDMAPFKFTKAIAQGTPIDVYNHGDMARDFTFVGDLAEAVFRLIDVVPGASPAVDGDSLSPVAPFRVVNIGQGRPVQLLDFIGEIEQALGVKAIMNMLPMQEGDVYATEASNALLERLTGYVPTTPVSVGVPEFVRWYRDYHQR